MKEMTTREALLYLAKENEISSVSELTRFLSNHYTKFSVSQVSGYLDKGRRMGVEQAKVLRKDHNILITNTYGKVLDV